MNPDSGADAQLPPEDADPGYPDFPTFGSGPNLTHPAFGGDGVDYTYPEKDDHRGRYAISGKIMVSAIIVLFLVVLFVFLLHVYARWFWRQSARLSRRNRRRSASMRRRFYFSGEEPARLRNVGLDSAVLEILPIYLYKSQDFTDGLECAVCLCEFEESEKARLLPNCGHSFHVDCIDMWFRSHSTCPVCRTRAQPEQPVLDSIRTEQVSATISGPIPSGIHDNQNSVPGQTAISAEECNVQNPTNIFSWDGQKQMNAEHDQGTSDGKRALITPQISIEIPKRRLDGSTWSGESHPLCSPNGSQSSSKSPVTRLRSLTRMLSRDTERKVFPSDFSGERDPENNGQ